MYFVFKPLAACVNLVSDQIWFNVGNPLASNGERHRTAVTSSLLFDSEFRNLHGDGSGVVGARRIVSIRRIDLRFGSAVGARRIGVSMRHTGVTWLLGLGVIGGGVSTEATGAGL